MRKSKIKNVRVMIGSGEHRMFINVQKVKKVKLMMSGMTFSEARHHLEEKEYEYLKEIKENSEKRDTKRHIFYLFSRKFNERIFNKKCILFD